MHVTHNRKHDSLLTQLFSSKRSGRETGHKSLLYLYMTSKGIITPFIKPKLESSLDVTAGQKPDTHGLMRHFIVITVCVDRYE